MPDEDCRNYPVQNELRGGIKVSGRLWHFVERRPVLISLATGIGLVSALLLWAAVAGELLFRP